MPPSKKKGKARAKAKGAKKNASQQPRTSQSQEPRRSISSIAVGATLGILLALGWEQHVRHTKGDRVLSSEALLAKVQRSTSFNLTNISTRTLTATSEIPSGTVLMEISRDLMIWDLDAARDEFIRRELFRAPLLLAESDNGAQSFVVDPMSKRAALLAAYLALLRNGVVPPSTEFPLHLSVARALPSYEEYAASHPVLADLKKVKIILGEHSPAFLHLVQVRESLSMEHASFASTSKKFASHVSLEDYLCCRIAVQSRAFEISNAGSAVKRSEKEYYQQNIGVDFSTGVVSIEPVNDWMNNHINNNVKVGGYDAKKGTGRAWATKTIHKGQELINSYGNNFYDYVLFSQYGYVPSDGTGTSVASLSVYHNISLLGGMMGGLISTPTLPPLETMVPYLQYDYGYTACIRKEIQPEAFELKRLKLLYLQHIAIDRQWWLLPLPPRVSTDATPLSTVATSNEVPSFGPDVYQYLETNALSVSLPCRLITLTHGELDDGAALLKEDLETLEASAASLVTPELQLEKVTLSVNWMVRTVHCMRKLAVEKNRKYALSVEDQERYVMTLGEESSNTLRRNTAHVKLEEMQSQEALENWAIDTLDSVSEIDGVSLDDLNVRDEPCPDQAAA